MPSQEVLARICRVKDALDNKGFAGIYATHYDNTPGRTLVLHDDCGHVAHGEDDALKRIIEAADDEASLWTGLEDSGMVRNSMSLRS